MILGNVGGACLGAYAMMKTKTRTLLMPLPFVIYALCFLHDHLAPQKRLLLVVFLHE